MRLDQKKVYSECKKLKIKLNNDYWKLELSLADITKKYDIKNTRSILLLLKLLKITTRQPTVAVQNAIFHKKMIQKSHTQYKHGYHMTWNKKYVYFRSSYEENLMKKLDKKNIDMK